MRKALATLLVAAVAVIGGRANAADQAGVSLTWGMGPVIQLGDFDMKITDGFTLGWNVTDAFSVGVYRNASSFRGENSYSDEAASNAIKYTLAVNGTVQTSGIQLMTKLPFLSLLSLGIDVGAVTFADDGVANTTRVTKSDGTASVGNEFGTTARLNGTFGSMGLAGRFTLIHASSKTVSTDIGVSGAFRFVSIPDTSVFGTQEAVKIAPATTKKIDPVTNYNNLAVLVDASLTF